MGACYTILSTLYMFETFHTKKVKQSARKINRSFKKHLRNQTGTSLVVQWLGIRLPMKGTRAQALVQEDPTCCGATKPVRHNY